MKRKIYSFLKVGVIIYVLIMFVLFFFGIMNDPIFPTDGIPYIVIIFEKIIIALFLSLLFVVATFMNPPFNFIIIYLIYCSITKNKIRRNSKFDKQNIQYCRENLDYLSPGILSYLKDFTIEPNKDICAHILKLIHDEYVIVENNSLKISDKDISTLSRSDKIILDIVKEKKISFNKKTEYTNSIEQEAMEQGFFTNKSIEGKKIVSKISGFFFIESFSILGFSMIFSSNLLDSLGILSFVIIFIAMLIMFLPFFYFIYLIISFLTLFKSNTNIIRTKKANEIIKNAYGLEKFLKDLNSFENKSWKEVYTRDYYLIYAVVLGINTKIPNEILEMLTN